MQRDAEAMDTDLTVFTEGALLDALLTHPELIVQDLFWAHGQWLLGPPQLSQDGRQHQARTHAPPEILALLPPTPPELTGSLQQLKGVHTEKGSNRGRQSVSTRRHDTRT